MRPALRYLLDRDRCIRPAEEKGSLRMEVWVEYTALPRGCQPRSDPASQPSLHAAYLRLPLHRSVIL